MQHSLCKIAWNRDLLGQAPYLLTEDFLRFLKLPKHSTSNSLLNSRMNTNKCFSAIICFLLLNVHFVCHRTLNILRSLSDWNRLSGCFNIFMSVTYMFPQIAPLNASIIAVRAFIRFFSSMNSSMFPQFIELPESLLTKLTCKWSIIRVNLHMHSQSPRGNKSLGTNRTDVVEFSGMNFL